MKFLRRESERGDFERPGPGSKRVMDNFQESPEPTPVAATKTASNETPSITMQTPDNVIGETLVVQGRVEFQNLLRIDGHFEGELIGNGSLIIGPTAEVISNLKGLNEVYVEGILIGDCVCNKMQIRFAGCVTGNLQCASLGMDPSVVLKGSANVNPRDKVDRSDSRSKSKNPPRHRQQRSQPRVSSDETSSSSRASTSAISPESIASSRAPAFEEDSARSKIGDDDDPAPRALVRVAPNVNDNAAASKGSTVSKQKSRSRGSGNLGNDAGGGGHGRGSSNDSTSSSPPKSVMEDGTSSSGPVVVPKLGEAVKMPVRSRPLVSASSKPTGTVTGRI